MRLHLVTAPTVEPVTLTEAKNHRRVTHSADDSEITSLIKAARELFEAETGRQVITATWRGTLDFFPPSGTPLRIPRPPLQSVTGITYIDHNGDAQTWGASLYTVKTFAGPYARGGLVFPVAGEVYPSTKRITDAVTVTFTAGYGDTIDDVPESVVATVKEYVGGLYEHRESDQDIQLFTNPVLERLTNRFRVPVYA